MDSIINITVDFNDAPMDRGVVISSSVNSEVKVGDRLRLIDMDPGAGFLVVTITRKEPFTSAMKGPLMRVYVEADGKFTNWDATL